MMCASLWQRIWTNAKVHQDMWSLAEGKELIRACVWSIKQILDYLYAYIRCHQICMYKCLTWKPSIIQNTKDKPLNDPQSQIQLQHPISGSSSSIFKKPGGLSVREAGILYFKQRSKILYTFPLWQLTERWRGERWNQRMSLLKGCTGGNHVLLRNSAKRAEISIV